MKISNELRAKREEDIEDLITNPITLHGECVTFVRDRLKPVGTISGVYNKLRWGAGFKEGRVIFTLMNDVNSIFKAEYKNFRDGIENLPANLLF